MSEWTADRMHELGSRHAQLEADCDIEGTMATVVPNPVYEFHPAGVRLEGRDQVRRYYEHLLTHFVPSTRGVRLLEEWASAASIVQEYEITVEVAGDLEAHRVIGILFAEGELLGGERIFSSERCARLMLGEALFAEGSSSAV